MEKFKDEAKIVNMKVPILPEFDKHFKSFDPITSIILLI